MAVANDLLPNKIQSEALVPAYVSFVAQKLAEIHADAPGMSVDAIGRITTDNAKRLFKIA